MNKESTAQLTAALLADITRELESATWRPLQGAPVPTAGFFEGTAAHWRLLVGSFSIEDQGFPPGTLGYDGTASRAGTIVHLTPELAKRAYELAVKSTPVTPAEGT